MIGMIYCHLVCIIFYCQGVRSWRVPGRPQSERAAGTSDDISANIQSRAAGSFLWARPPLVSEDYGSDPTRETDSERRFALIRQCTQTLERPGLYKIRGSSSFMSSSSSSFCYVMIKAPALNRIRVTFRRIDVDCQRSGLMLFDGWQLIDRKKPSLIDSIPVSDESDEDEERKLYLCSDNSEFYRTLETSQNIGQILYLLRNTDDELVFQIDHLPDTQVCDTYIGRNDEPITLNLRITRPRSCRIYVSGSARLRLTDVQLDTAARNENADFSCGNAGTNFVSVQANSTSWNPNSVRRRFYHCDTDLSDFNTPCRFNIIELHGASRAEQTATLTIDPLADEDREPWSYYCY